MWKEEGMKDEDRKAKEDCQMDRKMVKETKKIH